MFLTMLYIVIGLAVTTMCIDLAGTEYIRKIHYVGQKMETAKDLLGEGFQVGGEVLKQAHDLINVKNIAFLRSRGMLEGDIEDEEFQEQLANYLASDRFRTNVLYEPVSPRVRRLLKPDFKITPDEIQEGDAFILENKVYGQPLFPRHKNPNLIYTRKKNIMTESGHSESWPRRSEKRDEDSIMFIAPFILHESNV